MLCVRPPHTPLTFRASPPTPPNNSARDGVEEPYSYDYMGLMSLFFASIGMVTKLRICVWLSVFALCSATVNVRRSSLDSRTLMGAGMVLIFAFYTVYIQESNSGVSPLSA